MKKKLVAIILVLALSLGLTACAGGSTTPEKVELPQYKVGVILYNLSNDWALNIMKSIEYLGSNLNVTFDYAVGGTDPEQTITAAQNFGAAGIDGIINLHPGMIMPTLIEICEQYEMYIVTSNDPANAHPEYGTFSKSKFFAGEVWEDDFAMAYTIAEDMIKTHGAKTFALTGFPFGLADQMDKRLNGAKKAIEDNGATLLAEGLSFDKASAAANIVSQYPDIDAIFSSVESISTVYQSLVNAGLGDKVLLNCYDPGEGALEAMEEGVVNYAVEGTLADSMIAFVLLYNAMSGNRMTDADGNAASIEMEYVLAKSHEDFVNIQKYITGDSAPFTIDELKPFIKVLNKDAKLEGLTEFAQGFSLESVMARHGG